MMLTLDQLREILPRNKHVEEWHDALSTLLPDYEIDTPLRVAAFLAQCSHESAGFTAVKENLNYRWESLRRVFPKYFPNDDLAKEYASAPNKQEAIANRVYANRMGNGDEESGDGYKFRGRGVIQLTGRNNYTKFAEDISMDLDEAIEYLETFQGAVHSACWYWSTNRLNRFADEGDMKKLTRAINGGYIGLDDRVKHYEHIRHILNDE